MDQKKKKNLNPMYTHFPPAVNKNIFTLDGSRLFGQVTITVLNIGCRFFDSQELCFILT